VSLFFKPSGTRSSQIESRLLQLAALILFFFSAQLSLAPAIRLRTWDVTYRWQHWLGWIVWYATVLALFILLKRRLPDHDPYLLPIAALLSGWGLLTIWRLDEGYGIRQTIWIALSGGLCLLALQRSQLLLLLRRYKYIWLISGLILTGLTFFFGTYPGGEGPRLWLGFGNMYLQPSEPLKLLLIAYLAAYLADQLPAGNSLLRTIIPTTLLVGAALGMLLAQRDLGTASIFIFVYFSILYFSTGNRWVLVFTFVATLLAVILGYMLVSVIHTRIDSWINPWLDPSGKSYQIIQSLLAVAAGGVFGRGIGLGSPTLVPVAQSDYIFAAISEESGLVGVVALIMLYALLAGRGMLISLRASTSYKRYLSAGITAYFIIQSLVIIGGNIRLFPLTGITLPLVSYGGSSLLTSVISILLLLHISSNGEDEPAALVSSSPYLLMGGAMLAGLLCLALVSGYWSIIRSNNLLDRTDNPRRSIDDLYVQRGALLDRNQRPIVQTSGKPGDYTRRVLYPDLGPVVGYTNPTYGQAGLETSLDGYLRGLQGNSGLDIWFNHILYGQPPPGPDILLSIDLDLQQTADRLLGNQRGAIVLMNARSGEILAMASHPTFDPNQLDQNWEKWVKDPAYPLVNRAAQISYPVNTILGPFYYAGALENKVLFYPPVQMESTYTIQNKEYTWACAAPVEGPSSWPDAIINGCPRAVESLFNTFTLSYLAGFYAKTGLQQSPSLPLQVAPTDNNLLDILNMSDPNRNLISASPLQMAMLASTISSQGNLPSPLLTLSVNKGDQRIMFTAPRSTSVFPPDVAQQVATDLVLDGQPVWQSTSRVYQGGKAYAWFVGGTLPSWQGAPLAVAVVLESDSPAEARQMGVSLLETIIQPPSK
jgi:cell division protein FtsW (lipid II flippase)